MEHLTKFTRSIFLDSYAYIIQAEENLKIISDCIDYLELNQEDSKIDDLLSRTGAKVEDIKTAIKDALE